MAFFKKVIVFAFTLISIGTAITSCSSSDGSRIRLNGAGATFPSKIYTRWFSDLAALDGPRINYQAIGSGSGRKAFIDQTVDFGASDEPMKEKDIQKINRGLLQIPMIGGTIAFAYNYKCDLELTQEKAVQVAMGKINNWRDLGCPAGKLTWVHRSDGSGTTKAFTNSMQAFSENWTLGTGKSIKWLAGVGGKGNAGVASFIRNTPGAIGYLNQSYVKGGIKSAAVLNLFGEFVKPSSEAGAKALSSIQLDSNLVGSDPNPKIEGAYPIATLTWLLVYKTGNGRNLDSIKTMINYMLGDESQSKATSLGYVPLEGKILEKSRMSLLEIIN
ncbi:MULTISPECIES: phosphate ABC transporter substrate-binding protein PstS [unclassified Prochlorococcus]|uniref:phosphate ABC transporter substrate-binding protein PstS n=1 Tax=unclassified Prochlorococcus TaxID=2627481 RepID=UPI000533A623|nr:MULTISPECIES: phosphate ABC transporter substrate-binding protein PstS [unclassified Prochlorococcus]KGG16175.1 Phosphate ABC transporter [Prochlorococcus sp. MIT 0602]KGG17295.1 Phosphate ABC transporter [Prochlorococcus sp. MIT 0603]